MSDLPVSTRARRHWHIEQRFGRWYVVDDLGGFEGWHLSEQSAHDAMRLYAHNYGDTYAGMRCDCGLASGMDGLCSDCRGGDQ